MDSLKYGILIDKINDNVYYIQTNKTNMAKIICLYDFNNKLLENHVEIYKSGQLVIGYKDIIKFINDNGIIISFTRHLRKNKYIITLDENTNIYNVDLFLSDKLVKYIKSDKTKIKINKNNDKLSIDISKININDIDKFIVMDIETIDKNGVLTPCIISIFEGDKVWSFYLNDYNNNEDMFKACFESLMKRKYRGYSVYIDNFGNFDAIFLIKNLIKLGHIDPIIHNDKIITIHFVFGPKDEYNLKFKDIDFITQKILDKYLQSKFI